MSNYNEKKILIYVFSFVIHVVCAEKHDYIEVNYDIGEYKVLHVNETLELICKNKINTSPPSWYYHSRLHNDPRMKVSADGNQSRLVISNAQAEDAGKYRCEIEHDYEGKTHHFSKEIEVIVNEIYKVEQEETEDGIKLVCDVKAYPSSHVSWKIDYDNKELNPPTEAPDLNDDYWMPADPRVELHKSNGRFTLRPYKEVNNGQLIITDVTDDDNGKYYCVARNLVGEQCKSCTVNRTKRGVAVGVKSVTTGGIMETKNSHEGNTSTVSSTNGNAVLLETENSQKVENKSCWMIAGIGLAIVVIAAVVLKTDSPTTFKKRHLKLCQKKEEEIQVPEEERLTTLTDIICNEVSVKI